MFFSFPQLPLEKEIIASSTTGTMCESKWNETSIFPSQTQQSSMFFPIAPFRESTSAVNFVCCIFHFVTSTLTGFERSVFRWFLRSRKMFLKRQMVYEALDEQSFARFAFCLKCFECCCVDSMGSLGVSIMLWWFLHFESIFWSFN